MAKKQTKDIPAHLTPQLLLEFIHALHRIFKIGNYYPAGHKIVDQAAESFSISLKKVAETNRTVQINIGDEYISVESIDVTSTSKAKDEIHAILKESAIESLRFDREITIREMLLFVQRLLTHRAQIKSARHFTTTYLAKIPPSVKVRTKKFMIDESAIVDSHIKQSSEQELEEVFESLEKEGLTKSQVRQCRNLLNSLSKNFKIQQSAKKNLPNFTWNDVQNLLIKVIKNTFNPDTDTPETLVHNEVNALSTVLSNLEIDEEDEKAKESINLLISLIKRKQPTEQKKRVTPKLQKADKAPDVPIHLIQQFVDKSSLQPSILVKLSQVDKSEEICILFQLLQHEQTSEALIRSKFFLRDILSAPLNHKEWDVLLAATKLFFEQDNLTRFKEVLPTIVLQLRSSKYASSIRFLHQLTEKASAEHLLFLWPTIVNELIAVGIGKEVQEYLDLARKAASLNPKQMLKQTEGLVALDCFQEKRAAANIFSAQARESFLLFSFLLTTPLKEKIYAVLLPALQKQPPEWLGEAVLPFMQMEEEHIRFVQLYLANCNQFDLPAALKQVAGKLLLTHIPAISEEMREAPWVPHAIASCGKLPMDGMTEMLDVIANEKKMLFVHGWPSECREAAQTAMAQLK